MTTTAGRLAVSVLGPLRVVDAAGEDRTPAGVLPRRLLALLVLRRGTTVSVDSAVEALWPDGGPQDAAAALQSHVSRLRRLLPDVVETTAGGYRLDPTPLDVDAEALRAAVAEADVAAARPAEPDTALRADRARLEELLARWHGPAYPELEEVPTARAESSRLEELRVRARELLAELRLTTGETAGLAGDLRALVDEDPLRERPRALLMDVLAADGRVAEALQVYDELRRLLAEELGIEPSPALTERHAALLGGARGAQQVAESPPLPVPATSLVGREELLAELEPLAYGVRLLTLVGPGGVGKTRLLLELGHRWAASDPATPVVLVELAPADASTAVTAVAAALRIDPRPGTVLLDRVAGVVGARRLVLLLDNCEHVVDAVAHLVEPLLARCPGLRVVATSRERLRVSGEQVRRVPPLPAAGPDSPAAQLFVERSAAAGAVGPDKVDALAVASVAARLDGLPLAIELAAARMHAHDIDEIADGLDERFAFLSAGSRTATRHGSLAAVVQWSHDLLDPPLRTCFADLSVFTGSFDVSAAARVCGLEEAECADLLVELVERSMLMRHPGRRYLLLETLREFGREQLRMEGRWEQVAQRHAQHVLSWSEEVLGRIGESGSPSIQQIDDAVPELRRVLGWLLAGDQVEAAAELVGNLLDYGLLRLRPDVLAWAEHIVAADPHDETRHAPQVRAAAAYAAWLAGRPDSAAGHARRGLAAASRTGGVPARVAAACGVVELFAGRLREALGWYEQAAARAAVDEPDYWFIAQGTVAMIHGYLEEAGAAGRAEELLVRAGRRRSGYTAYAWYCAGEAVLDADPPTARERLRTALALAEETGSGFVTGVAGASLASLDVRLGEHDAAVTAYRWLVPHFRRAGGWATQWVMLRSIAALLQQLGQPEQAAVIEGAVRAVGGVTGPDAALLDELADQLRTSLGESSYRAALERGAALHDDALLDHVLEALARAGDRRARPDDG